MRKFKIFKLPLLEARLQLVITTAICVIILIFSSLLIGKLPENALHSRYMSPSTLVVK